MVGLTEEQKRQIKSSYLLGETMQQIAVRFDVSKTTIGYWCKDISRKGRVFSKEEKTNMIKLYINGSTTRFIANIYSTSPSVVFKICQNVIRTKSEALTTHGMSKSKLYGVWQTMKSRCGNKNVNSYKYYGGRGINVCDEWLDVECFIKWALENGYREGLEIDRKDYDLNYNPNNCHWVTKKENLGVGKQRIKPSCKTGYRGISKRFNGYVLTYKGKHIKLYRNINDAIKKRIELEIKEFGEVMSKEYKEYSDGCEN